MKPPSTSDFRLIALLQQELGENPDVKRSSGTLRLDSLHAIAQTIWPPAGG